MFFKKLFKKKENKVTINLGANPSISKELLDEIAKKLPKDVRPTIVQTEGEITYVQENGKLVRINVPLINIVPIPSFKIEDINVEDFGSSDGEGKETKKIVVDVPVINITPVPSFNVDDFEYDENGFLKKKVKK